MGGMLQLNNAPQSRANVCISGYNSAKPNYALSNFQQNPPTGYNFMDPDIGLVTFPTAEHFLHFQKMTPAFKRNPQNVQAWKNRSAKEVLDSVNPKKSIFSSTDYLYSDIDPNKPGYSQGKNGQLSWDENKVQIQMHINAMKYQQSPAFKQAIDTSIQKGKTLDGGGPVSIIEDTSSASYDENKWGTGKTGGGTNILGNSQTAFATMIASNPASLQQLTQRIPAPAITKNAYDAATHQFTTLVQPHLMQARQHAYPSTLDTSDLPNVIVLSQSGSQPSVKTPPPVSNVTGTSGYYMSSGGNQRLIIQNNQIVGREFRRDANARWEVGIDSSRFTDLEKSFYQHPQIHIPLSGPTAPGTSGYYMSSGGNQRLIIQNNQIVGREFRRDANARWEVGTDPSRFADLEKSFYQHPQIHIPLSGGPTAPGTSGYYMSSGGNQRLIIQNNQIMGREFRRDANARWEVGTDPSRFADLENSYRRTLPQNPSSTPTSVTAAFRQQVKTMDKDAILREVKQEINNCASLSDLQSFKKAFSASPAYATLAHHTSIGFGKTASIKAYEKMLEDKEDGLRSAPSFSRPK